MEHEHHLSKIWFKVIYHIVKVLNLQEIGLKKKKKKAAQHCTFLSSGKKINVHDRHDLVR